MFFSTLQWAFEVFNIHLMTLENQKLSIEQFYCAHLCWLPSQRYPNSCPLQPFDQQQPF
jgi:hypothetical protein